MRRRGDARASGRARSRSSPVRAAGSGAGRGAGASMRRGAEVVIAARSRERVEAAAAALGAAARLWWPTSPAPGDVARLVDGTIETHGRIDVLDGERGCVRRRRPLGERTRGARPPSARPTSTGVVRTVRAVAAAPPGARRGRHPRDELRVGPSGDPLGARVLRLQARAPSLRPRDAPTAHRNRRPHGRHRPRHRAQRAVGRLRSRRDRGEDRARRGDPVRGRRRRGRPTCSLARGT